MRQPIHMFDYLKENAYPGRGIMIGKRPDGLAVAAYFIMGRSASSRNRVFVAEGDDLRTQAFDSTALEKPELLIYHPVRVVKDGMIVTNGDQTDYIDEKLEDAYTFADALRDYTFEPDPPIYTPRISGLMMRFPVDFTYGFNYKLSILKSTPGSKTATQRQFFEYESVEGLGHLIHTYQGDGDPVPSFEGEPVAVELDNADIDTFTAALWDSLNPDNKVSLFVRYIDMGRGTFETRIVNKNQ